jgi:PAS domain S-box-containing protein
MSDSSAAGPVPSPAITRYAATRPAAPRPEPIGMLVVDATSGQIAATNPAARRCLTGEGGVLLGRWLSDLATGDELRDITLVHRWPAGPTGPTGAPGPLAGRALATPIAFRSRRCLLVVLRPDAAGLPPVPLDGTPVADPACAVFTLDAVGRIDSWGSTAQRLTGFRAEHVIGSDTTPLHPAPARLAGEPHRALTLAYRTGEHRAQDWRLCSDGRLLWAEVTTAPLYDGIDRLIGFATVVQDLTPVRRVRRPAEGMPLARAAELTIDLRTPVVPAPRPAPVGNGGAGVRPAGRGACRIPAPRRPADG